MKKIAYIFHGHSRTWAKCHENFFKNVYSQLPGDIFIHTWDKVNASQGSYWSPTGYSLTLPDKQLQISNQTPDITGIYKTYNPKVLIIEPDRKPDLNILNGVNHTFSESTFSHLGVKNMLYQSIVMFDIATGYDKYDYIFSTRLDIDYPVLISADEIELMLNSNSITVPWIRPDSISDIWMFGPTDLMKIKTDYYQHVDNFWLKKYSDLNAVTYETALLDYLNHHSVSVRSTKLPSNMIRLF